VSHNEIGFRVLLERMLFESLVSHNEIGFRVLIERMLFESLVGLVLMRFY